MALKASSQDDNCVREIRRVVTAPAPTMTDRVDPELWRGVITAFAKQHVPERMTALGFDRMSDGSLNVHMVGVTDVTTEMIRAANRYLPEDCTLALVKDPHIAGKMRAVVVVTPDAQRQLLAERSNSKKNDDDDNTLKIVTERQLISCANLARVMVLMVAVLFFVIGLNIMLKVDSAREHPL